MTRHWIVGVLVLGCTHNYTTTCNVAARTQPQAVRIARDRLLSEALTIGPVQYTRCISPKETT